MSAIKARGSGICPLCSTYIAKNRSWIVSLPESIRPRCTEDGVFSLDTAQAYNANGKPISQHARKWVHEDCYPKYNQEPAHADFTSRNEEVDW